MDCFLNQNNVQSLTEQLSRVINDRTILPQLKNNIRPERTTADMVDQLEFVYENSWQYKDINSKNNLAASRTHKV